MRRWITAAFALALMFGGSVSNLLAADLVWTNSNGTWDTSTLNWTNSSGTGVSFTDGGVDTVIFRGTTGGIIDVTTNMTPVSILVTNTSGTFTFTNGPIAGASSLTKAGAGTLYLAVSNAYSGDTVLNAGILEIGADGALGTGTLRLVGGTFASMGATRTIANAVSVDGNLAYTVTGGANTIFNGVMTLTGDRTINLGSGLGTISIMNGIAESGGARNLTFTQGPVSQRTATLAGASTYTGTTTVNDINLVLQGTSSSSGFILNSGNLSLDGDNALGTGTLTVNGGTIQSETSVRTITNNVTVNADFDVGASSGGGLNFGGTVTLAADTRIIAYGNPVTFTNTSVIAESGGSRRLILWSNPGGSSRAYYFGGTSTYSGGTMVTGAFLNASAVNSLPTNGALTILGISTTQQGQFNLNGFDQTIGSLSGNVIQNTVLLGANTLTTGVDNSNTTYSGIISGTGGNLVKIGSGTFTLSGTNTYTGATTVSGGTLQLGINSTVPKNSAVTVASGATFDLAGFTNHVGSLAGAGSVTLGTGWLYAGTNGTDTVFSGVMSDTGGFTKEGGGTMVLASANTYSGLTTNQAGILMVITNEALGTAAGGTFVTNGATLGFSNSVNYTTAEQVVISGTGAGGRGAIANLDGDNIFAGAITNSAAATIGSLAGTLTLNGVITNSVYLLAFTNAAGTTITINGQITGTTGGLNKDGSGTTVLAAAANYGGATTISGGTLRYGINDAISNASAVTVGAAGTLDLNNLTGMIGSLAGAGSVTIGSGYLTAGGNNLNTSFSGLLSGSGGFTKTGTGVMTLWGTNSSFTGVITNNGGMLMAATNNALGTADSGTFIANGAMLGFTNNVNYTTLETVSIQGIGANGWQGAMVNVGGNNTFNGLITNAGDATISSYAGTLTLNGAITNSGFPLTFTNVTSTRITVNGVISGSGTVRHMGASGPTVLAGQNTYTGSTTNLSGWLFVATNNALGTAESGTFIANGAVLGFTNNVNYTTLETISIDGFGANGWQGAIANIYGNNTFNGLITNAGDATISTYLGNLTLNGAITNSGFPLTFTNVTGTQIAVNGIIDGSGSVRHLGAGGTTVLAGQNTYTGSTTNLSGMIFIATNNALGTADSGTFIANGAGLGFTNNVNYTTLETISIKGTGANAWAGAIASISGNNTFDGLITNTGDASISSRLGILTLNGAITNSGFPLTFTNWTGTQIIVNGIIDGSGALRHMGTGGATILAGQNTYTGSTTNVSGMMYIATNNALGTADNGTFIANGAMLGFSNNVNYTTLETISIRGTGDGNWQGAIANISGNNTFDGLITNAGGTATISSFAGSLTLNGAITNSGFPLTFTNVSGTQITVNGIIDGSGALRHMGAGGTTVLAGQNTYTGGTTNVAGLLIVATNNALGTIDGGSTIGSGGTLAFSNNVNYTTLETVSIAGLGNAITGWGAISSISGDNTFAGLITNAADASIGSTNGTLTLTGAITNYGYQLTFTNAAGSSVIVGGTIDGSGRLIHGGAGTTVLAGQNTYTGDTTNAAGLLIVATNNALGTAAGGTLVVGGTLGFSNNVNYTTAETIGIIGTGVGGRGAINNLAGNNTFAGTITNRGAATIGSSEGSLTLNGAITNSGFAVSFTNAPDTQITLNGQITGTGGLIKIGEGTTVLAAAGNYSGATSISNGTLRLGINNAISNASAVTVVSPGVLDLYNWTTTVGSLAGGGSVALNSGYLVAGDNNNSTTFSGALIGEGGFTKTGTGVLTVSGVNSAFDGVITNAAGTMLVFTNEALGTTAGITVILSGASLAFTNAVNYSTAETLRIAGTGSTNTIATNMGAVYNHGGNNTFAGVIINDADATIGAKGGRLDLTGAITNNGYQLTFTNAPFTAIVVSGAISGSGPIWHDSGTQGNLVLAADNSGFTGAITNNAWWMAVSTNNALGTTDGSTVIMSGARLDFSNNVNYTTAELIGIAGAGNNGLGAILNLSGNNTFAGVITNNADAVIGSWLGRLDLTGSITNSGYQLTFTNVAGTSIHVTGTISGSGPIWHDGTNGLTVLGGNNTTFTGAITNNTGYLVVSANNALGSTDGATIVKNGARLDFSNNVNYTTTELIEIAGQGSGGWGAIVNLSGNNTFAGVITNVANAQIGTYTSSLTLNGAINNGGYQLVITNASNTQLDITGILSGSGLFQHDGAGATVLAANNSQFTGLITNHTGLLMVAADGALGTTDGITVVRSGATLGFSNSVNYATAETIQIAGSGVGNLGVIRDFGGNNIFAGVVTNYADAAIGAMIGNLTFNGAIHNAGYLFGISNATGTMVTIGGTIIGTGLLRHDAADATGTLVLAGNNSQFDGIITNTTGLLIVSTNSALGTTAGVTVVRSGSTLGFSNSVNYAIGETTRVAGVGVGGSGAINNLVGDNIFAGVITNTAAATIGVNAGTLTLSGPINNGGFLLSLTNALGTTITINNQITGTGGLNKYGDGVTVLAAAGNYSGATTISNGTVRFGINDAISNASAVAVAAPGVLDLNNLTGTIGSLAGDGSVTIGSGYLTAGGNNTSTTFSGLLSGSGGFAKAGTGVMSLSGTNTSFTGVITNQGGTLLVFTNDALGTVANNTVILSGASVAFTNAVNYTTLETLRIAGTGSTNYGATNMGAIYNYGQYNAFDGAIINDADATIGATGGRLDLTGAITNGGYQLSFTNLVGSMIVVSGAINGSGPLAFSGTGKTVLAANNSGFTGAITNEGFLVVSTNGALGTTAGATIVRSGGRLDFSNNVNYTTTELIEIAGQGNGSWGAILNFDGDNTFAGVITNAADATIGSLRGTLTLNGAITNSGYQLSFTNLVNSQITVNGTINGSGPIWHDGAGTTILTANNDQFTGVITNNQGFLIVSTNGALGTTDGGTLVRTWGTLGFSNNVNYTAKELVAIQWAGATNLSNQRMGSIANLSGNNTFDGVITNIATAWISSIEGSLTLNGAITNSNYRLDFTNAPNTLITVNGILSGSGPVWHVGAGTTVLTANNDQLTGAITNGSGFLIATVDGALGTTAGFTRVEAAGTLGFSNSVNYATAERVEIVGGGATGWGAISSLGGDNIFAGVISNTGAATIGSPVGTLTLNGVISNYTGQYLTFTNAPNTLITVNAPIIGAGYILKGGDGTTVINNNNTLHTGYIGTQSGGLLIVTTNNALGATVGATASTFVRWGSTIGFSNNVNYTATEIIRVSGDGFNGMGAIANLSGDNTFAGSITNNIWDASTTIGSMAGSLTLSGSISNYTSQLTFTNAPNTLITVSGQLRGTAPIWHDGAGTTVLAATNTLFAGVVTNNAGFLIVANTNALGIATSNTVVMSGATLGFSNSLLYTTAEQVEIAGSGVNGVGAIASLSGDNLFAGVITNAANATIGVSAGSLALTGSITNDIYQLTFTNAADTLLTLGGTISGSGVLWHDGAGTMTITNSNAAFTGAITNNAGLLIVSTNNALGTIAGATVVNAGTLGFSNSVNYATAEQIAIAGSGVGGVGAINNLAGDNTFAGTITNTAAATIGISAGNLTLSGALANGGYGVTLTNAAGTQITISGVLSGAGSVRHDGTGTVVLGGNNAAFTGAITNNAGVLNIQHSAGVGTTAGGVTIANGAALELQGGISVGAEALTLGGTGISGNGVLRNVSGNNIWGGTATLTGASTFQSDAGTLTLSAATAVDGAAQNLTLEGAGNGVISGIIATTSGTITKNDAGTWTLSGANTFTGAVAVNEGALNIQNANGAGTTAGGVTVANGAALELQGNASVGAEALSIAGTGIGGNGALRNVSGANAWGGAITAAAATTIGSSAGTLTLGGGLANGGYAVTLTNAPGASIVISGTLSGAGGLVNTGTGATVLFTNNTFTGSVIMDGGTVDLRAASALGSTGGIILNEATLLFSGSTGITDRINDAATLTLGGGTLTLQDYTESLGVVTLNTSSVINLGVDGNNDDLTFANAVWSAGILTINNWTPIDSTDTTLGGLDDRIFMTVDPGASFLDNIVFNGWGVGALRLGSGQLTPNASAAIWTGGGGDNAWGTDGNWNSPGTPASGRTLIFAGNLGQLTNNIDGAISANYGGVTFATNAAGSFLIGGGMFTNGAGGIANNSAYLQSFTNTLIAMSYKQTWNAASNNLFISSAVTNGGYQLTLTGMSNITLSGTIDGAGGLFKNGAGTVSLEGNNLYTGATTNAAGTLVVMANNALGTTAGGTVISSGATLGFSNNVNYSTTEFVEIAGTGVNGVGAINNMGGINSFAGTITNTAAATIGASGGALTLSGNITNSGYLLTFTNANQTLLTVSGVIQGSGGLNKDGAGTNVLAGVNQYWGATTISGGTLQLGVNNAISNASAVTVAGGATFNLDGFSDRIASLDGAGSVTLGSGRLYAGTNGVNTVYSGVMSGTGGLTKEGTGTMVLAGTNSYGGVTTNLAGILMVATTNALGTTAGHTVVISGATLGFSNSANYSTAELISIAGTGVGGDGAIVNYSGDNIFTGLITNAANATIGVRSGTLVLSGGITNAATTLTLTNTALTQLTISGVIQGSGGLNSGGAGTNVLSAVNLYTGATTISGGTLQLGVNNAISSASALTVTNSGTLDLNNFTDTIGSLAGPGAVMIGSGYLTAGGNNTGGVFSGALSGGGGFTKAGTGGMTLLGNSSSFTGVITNSAGMLIAGTNNALGTADSGTFIANGAMLGFTNNVNYTTLETVSIQGSGANGWNGAIVNVAGNNTFDGLITNAGAASIVAYAGNLTLNGAITNSGFPLTFTNVTGTRITVNGVISGSGALRHMGVGGYLELTGQNTYTGSTTNVSGLVYIATNNALGTADNGTFIANGALLGFSNNVNYTTLETISINGFGAQGLNGAIANISGNNTFDGLITNAGAASIVSYVGNLTLNGAITNSGFPLTFTNWSGTQITVNGIIDGSGALRHMGASGTTVLAGQNTYTGSTTNLSGWLFVATNNALGTADSGTFIANGAVLGFTNNVNYTTLETVSINGIGANGWQGALVNIDGDNTFNGLITNAGAATISSYLGNLTLNGAITNSGFPLTFTNVAGTRITVNGTIDGSGALRHMGSSGYLVLAGQNTYTGDTTNTSGILLVTTNNALGTAAGGTTVAGGILGFSNSVNYTTAEIIGIAGTGGSGLGAISSLGGDNTFAGVITNNAAATIGSPFGSLTLNGAITNSAWQLIFTNAPGTQITVNGAINGSGSVFHDGAGTTVLTANNTGFTGAITNNNGFLIVTADGALGTTAGLTVVTNATLGFSNSVNYATTEEVRISGAGANGWGAISSMGGDNIFAGIITNIGPATIGASAGTLTLNGVISNSTAQYLTFTNAANTLITVNAPVVGGGYHVKGGDGTMVITADNTLHTGYIGVEGGILLIPTNGALGATVGATVSSYARLGGTIGFSNNVNYAATEIIRVSGNGVNGMGVIANLSGDNTFAGSITNNIWDASTTIGSMAGSLTLSGSISNYISGSQLTFTNAPNTLIIVSGQLRGSGAIWHDGAGTTVLAATNTLFTGVVTNNAGFLVVAANNALGTIVNNTTVMSGSTLGFSNSINYATVERLRIAGTGADGFGVINNLSGDNIFAGTITNDAAATIGVSAGTLRLNGVIDNDGYLLTLTNAALTKLTLAGVVRGAGGLNSDGAGTNVLLAVNQYTGATTISGGTLQLGVNNAISNASTVTVASGAVFDLAGFNDSIGALEGAGNVTLGAGRLNAGTNGANTIYSGVMSGTGGLTKEGTGTMVLSGVNTYSGVTTNLAGMLIVSTNNALGDASGFTLVTNGGTLGFSNSVNYATAEPLRISGSGVNGIGAINNLSGDNTFAGAITNISAATIGSSAGTLTLTGSITNGASLLTFTNAAGTTITVSGVIMGSGGLNKDGSGTTILAAADRYSGATTISDGILRYGINNAISNVSAVTVAAPGTLDLNNYTGTIGSLDGAGSVTLGSGYLTAGTNSVTDFSGAMSGSGGFTKTGTGTMTLSGNSTYDGVTTNFAGLLIAASNNALGSANAGTVVISGATLGFSNSVNYSSVELVEIAGTGTTNASGIRLGVINNLSGDNNFAGVITNSAAATIGSSAGTLTLTGAITNNNYQLIFTNAANTQIAAAGILSGSGPVWHDGAGTTVLAANNTQFTGAITNNRGFLVVSTNNALGTAGAVTVVKSGGTLGFSNNVNYATAEQIRIAGSGVNGLGAINNLAGINTFAGVVTNTANATIGSSAGTLTFTDSVASGFYQLTVTNAAASTNIFSGVLSGSGGLTKTGAGALILSGASANTLSGEVTTAGGTLVLQKTDGTDAIAGDLSLTAGTLLLAASNQIANTSAITMKGGATFRTDGYSDTLGVLTLEGNAYIDMNGTSGILRFANSSGATWLAGILEIDNWDYATDQLFFGTDDTGLTTSQLNQILFKDPNGLVGTTWQAGMISGNGLVTPVPEPSGILAGILLLPLLLRRAWRRMRSP